MYISIYVYVRNGYYINIWYMHTSTVSIPPCVFGLTHTNATHLLVAGVSFSFVSSRFFHFFIYIYIFFLLEEKLISEHWWRRCWWAASWAADHGYPFMYTPIANRSVTRRRLNPLTRLHDKEYFTLRITSGRSEPTIFHYLAPGFELKFLYSRYSPKL